MPERIQMSRQHPWRAEHPDAVIVDRRTRWGNPFRIVRDGLLMGEPLYRIEPPDEPDLPARFYGGESTAESARRHAVEYFRAYLDAQDITEIREELAGKDLACWCPLDQPCHADVLLAIAAGETP
jgi:hypothetical protein